jgi:hypothetical protein
LFKKVKNLSFILAHFSSAGLSKIFIKVQDFLFGDLTIKPVSSAPSQPSIPERSNWEIPETFEILLKASLVIKLCGLNKLKISNQELWNFYKSYYKKIFYNIYLSGGDIESFDEKEIHAIWNILNFTEDNINLIHLSNKIFQEISPLLNNKNVFVKVFIFSGEMIMGVLGTENRKGFFPIGEVIFQRDLAIDKYFDNKNELIISEKVYQAVKEKFYGFKQDISSQIIFYRYSL